MADKLTPQQSQAVWDRGGKLLVSAAAGSGKTKVLVDRLLSYLTDPDAPANLDDFLIITYTKAAAAELRGKIASKLTERISEEPENRHLQKQMQRLFLAKISTVHGFCGDLLREYAYKLDIPVDFRVADENECRELREAVLAELLDQAYLAEYQDEDFRAFMDTQGLGRDDRNVPELIQKVYDSARCHLDPAGWLENCVLRSNTEDIQDVSETVWGKFLIDDLHCYLDAQINVMQQCVKLAEESGGLEKQIVNLKETLIQLQQLYGFDNWDDIVRHNKIEYGRLVFPKKNVDMDLVERIKAARNACKKGTEKKLSGFADLSEQIMTDMQQCASGTRGLIKLVQQFDHMFSKAKRSRRILDFGDLEHGALDLLLGKSRSSATVTAKEIGRRFCEIMVDEYQDSNEVQDEIFGALTEEKQNCFMVGDVKQSIYQFRLADPGIFLEKYQTFVPAQEAESRQGRKVLLSHNFRSGAEVISAVNDVFSYCMTPAVGGLQYGEAEALREGIPHEPIPEAVELHCLQIEEDTYEEEATFTANRIHRMLQEGTLIRKNGKMQPVEPEDIVILLRSPGSIGMHFQRALEKKGIRCSTGSGYDLLETEEIGTLCAFLQVIVNPRQDIPLISTLASPIFGFTADDLAQIRSRQKKGSFYDALLISGHPKASGFLEKLLVLRKDARQYSLTQLLERCFSLTRMDSIYSSMEGGSIRRSNLQTFFQMAVDYEQGNLRDLTQFLQHIEALRGKGLTCAAGSTSGCVTIMSIHKSKGLEFPVVFLCGLSRSFNRESLQAQILCDKKLGLGLSVADRQTRIRYPSCAKRAIMIKSAQDSLSEEMRVLYVAMTRARDRLIMTYAAKNLQAEIQDLVLRMDFDNGRLLCSDVGCPGKWVLLAAVQRMEAGELHAFGGRPEKIHLSDSAWKICVSSNIETVGTKISTEYAEDQMLQCDVERLGKDLSFRYPNYAATIAPSKRTATDRKGRLKDHEAADNSGSTNIFHGNWRVPSFIMQKTDAKAYGNAIHAAMQYIRYEDCGGPDQVRLEIERLCREGFLSQDQADMVDCKKINAFFDTKIGRKLHDGISCVREFKFSILDDACNYGGDLEGEQVLLQGVVDCAIMEPDGITIIDFKTDRVTEASVPDAVERYRLQVETYAEALRRIFELPVKEKYLYFFHLDHLYLL